MSSQPPCPDCGGPAAPWHRVGDRNRRLSSATFEYARCGDCRLVFLPEPPADLDRYYPDEYYALPASRDELVAGSRQHDGYKVELIRQFVRSGRLVEVGPAIGGFVALAQDAGYDTHAIEMDSRCCEFLNDVVGVSAIHTADTDTALAVGGPYDVIAMWHVIEHLRDPFATLAVAAGALAPGGILVIAAPNPDAWQLRVMGRRWTHIDAPRHLFLIPVESLERAAARLGLEVALATTTDEGTLGWNRFGWRETLAHSVRSVKGGHALRHIGSVVAAAAAPFERRDRRGSTYTVVLRRPD